MTKNDKLNQNIEKLNANLERLLNFLESSQQMPQGVMVSAPLVAEMTNLVNLSSVLEARGLSLSQEDEIATVRVSNPVIAKQCNSDCFEQVAYNAKEKRLTVWFRGNRSSKRAYSYQNISPRMFDEFISAPSLGRYYQRHIKGNYNLA